MRRDNSPGSEKDTFSVVRFVIGAVVGIITIILGLFVITDPPLFRFLVLGLGAVQLIVSGSRFAQIMRARSTDNR